MTVQVETGLVKDKLIIRNSPNPTLEVLAWELNLMAARPAIWLFLAAVPIFSAFLTWSNRQLENSRFDEIYPIYAHPTSGLGAIIFEVTVIGFILGILIPLLFSGSVARDYRRRTQELLMTTPLPGWAYIWGRYLAGLLLGLVVAALMLAGVILMGFMLALDLPLDQYKDISFEALQNYPPPNLAALCLVWLGMVLPTLLLSYSLSFGLVTLWPRRAGMVKAVFIFGWMLSSFYWLILGDHTHFDAWHPNYFPVTWRIQETYMVDYHQIFSQTQGNSPELRFRIAGQVEQKLFDIWTWQFPHLLYIILSLALVIYGAIRYQRNRGS